MNKFFKEPKKINILLFLASDSFLGITYPLSIFLALGFSGLLVFNYITTYVGFNQTFLALAWWVILGFVAVTQGVQLVIPILEAHELHSDLPWEWRICMWGGWLLAVLADFYTAVVALAYGTGMKLTASFVLFDSQMWSTGDGLLVIIFAGLLITAEIWVALSWRAVFLLHKRFWNMIHKVPSTYKPTQSSPSMASSLPRPGSGLPRPSSYPSPIPSPLTATGVRPYPSAQPRPGPSSSPSDNQDTKH